MSLPTKSIKITYGIVTIGYILNASLLFNDGIILPPFGVLDKYIIGYFIINNKNEFFNVTDYKINYSNLYDQT